MRGYKRLSTISFEKYDPKVFFDELQDDWKPGHAHRFPKGFRAPGLRAPKFKHVVLQGSIPPILSL